MPKNIPIDIMFQHEHEDTFEVILIFNGNNNL